MERLCNVILKEYGPDCIQNVVAAALKERLSAPGTGEWDTLAEVLHAMRWAGPLPVRPFAECAADYRVMVLREADQIIRALRAKSVPTREAVAKALLAAESAPGAHPWEHQKMVHYREVMLKKADAIMALINGADHAE